MTAVSPLHQKIRRMYGYDMPLPFEFHVCVGGCCNLPFFVEG